MNSLSEPTINKKYRNGFPGIDFPSVHFPTDNRNDTIIERNLWEKCNNLIIFLALEVGDFETIRCCEPHHMSQLKYLWCLVSW